jgi:hypothetical protein
MVQEMWREDFYGVGTFYTCYGAKVLDHTPISAMCNNFHARANTM